MINKNDSFALFKGKGYIKDPLVEVRTRGGTKAYTTYLHIKRRSEIEDIILIIIYEDHLSDEDIVGKFIEIEGYVKSRNVIGEDKKRHLRVYVYVDNLNILHSEMPIDIEEYYNSCEILGYLCNGPVFRITPKGKKITDLMLAVNYFHSTNSTHSTASYIPAILWSETAVEYSECPHGTRLHAIGRFQSREYVKDEKTCTAYEISISNISTITESLEDSNSDQWNNISLITLL